MTTNTIHVALASDNNYFEGLLTTAWSIARNCSRKNNLVLHILNGGINEKSLRYLRSLLSPLGCETDIINIDQSASFKGFKPYHGNGTMTYARLLLPDLLPTVSSVIYSDVDMLWLADIAELWDTANHNSILNYVANRSAPIPEEKKWFLDNGFAYNQPEMFCAGMIVLNLDKFRNERLHLKMLKTIQDNDGNLPLCDETVLKAHMFGRSDKTPLPYRWLEASGGKRDWSCDGFAVHFCADAPWKGIRHTHHMITDHHMLWHRYHAEARNISLWESLRECNRLLDIVIGRPLYLAATNLAPVRAILHLAMIIRGKKGNIPCLDFYMRKFKLPKSTRHFW